MTFKSCSASRVQGLPSVQLTKNKYILLLAVLFVSRVDTVDFALPFVCTTPIRGEKVKQEARLKPSNSGQLLDLG